MEDVAMRSIIFACAFAGCLTVTAARAQTTFVNPTPGGGYVINTPGQSPSFANPTPGGGYVVNTPGQSPTFVNPTPGGGYTINTPGQPHPGGMYGGSSGGMYGR
jgi:hypothetical protein